MGFPREVCPPRQRSRSVQCQGAPRYTVLVSTAAPGVNNNSVKIDSKLGALTNGWFPPVLLMCLSHSISCWGFCSKVVKGPCRGLVGGGVVRVSSGLGVSSPVSGRSDGSRVLVQPPPSL